MKSMLVCASLVLLCATSVKAQTASWSSTTISGTFFAGASTDRKPAYDGYVDVGIDGGTTFEGWVQTNKGERSFGGDILVIPKWIGLVVGGDNDGFHLGGAVQYKGLQARLMYHAIDQVWLAVINYTINLPKKTYVQLWAAPDQRGSVYLVGIGYNFKQ